jgi:hypothetical protein
MRALRRARLRARPALPLIVLLALSACPTAAASATAPSVKLKVALTPERLGQGTTLEFDFQITTPHGRVPPPLTTLELRYPANLGLINSGLGLATCSPATLEVLGPEGCPPDSLMGHGSALVEIPIGPEIVHETGHITTWLGPVQDGHLALLFYADGESPVSAQLIFSSLVLEAAPPYGGNLATNIPIIPGLPEAPNASVVQMHATIGSQGITYYTHSHGRRIPYRPDGLRLPHTCPHGGFPFSATFAFSGGARTSTRATVPCPTKQKQ